MSSSSLRLTELRRAFGFSVEDAAMLARFFPYAAPKLPAIVEEFYSGLRLRDDASEALREAVESKRLHGSLHHWLGELLVGPFDDAYLEAHARVSQVHVRVGLELRDMVAAMSRIRIALQRVAREAPFADVEHDALAGAIARACDFDLGIMLETYNDDWTRQLAVERHARSRDRLEAASTLAAGIAHEIRNPLHGASLHVSVIERALSRDPTAPSTLREAAIVLRTELKRVAALVSEFLEFARPAPPVRERCDVGDVARTVAELVRLEAARRGVVLDVEAGSAPLYASLDVERVTQALVHLLRNAVEATPAGGHCGLAVRPTEGAVEIVIRDDGTGIADASAPIFDAFYTTKVSGTGLGLSIAHRVVSDHGGDIQFASHPGHTVFTVKLPWVHPRTP